MKYFLIVLLLAASVPAHAYEANSIGHMLPGCKRILTYGEETEERNFELRFQLPKMYYCMGAISSGLSVGLLSQVVCPNMDNMKAVEDIIRFIENDVPKHKWNHNLTDAISTFIIKTYPCPEPAPEPCDDWDSYDDYDDRGEYE